jgi:hypothetical protein
MPNHRFSKRKDPEVSSVESGIESLKLHFSRIKRHSSEENTLNRLLSTQSAAAPAASSSPHQLPWTSPASMYSSNLHFRRLRWRSRSAQPSLLPSPQLHSRSWGVIDASSPTVNNQAGGGADTATPSVVMADRAASLLGYRGLRRGEGAGSPA